MTEEARADEQAAGLPAVLVNRFHVHVGPRFARVAFGEKVASETMYRFVAAMTVQDLRELADLIKEKCS